MRGWGPTGKAQDRLSACVAANVLKGVGRLPAHASAPERPDIVTRQPVLSLSTATAQPTARCEVWNFASGQGRVPTTPSNGAERSARKIRANARRNGGGSNRCQT